MVKKIQESLYKVLLDRASQFPKDNYAEIAENDLLAVIKVENSTINIAVLREYIRRLAESKKIELAPGDAGFPNDSYNFHYRYKIITGRRSSPELDLYITPDGDLYREPKEKYCYSLENTSKRIKILRFLIKNKGYQATNRLQGIPDAGNLQTRRTEIQKINYHANLLLKLKDKLIEGRKGSGYRINPKYRIKEMK